MIACVHLCKALPKDQNAKTLKKVEPQNLNLTLERFEITYSMLHTVCYTTKIRGKKVFNLIFHSKYMLTSNSAAQATILICKLTNLLENMTPPEVLQEVKYSVKYPRNYMGYIIYLCHILVDILSKDNQVPWP